ncbi:hypothetical protein BJ875DRAFT_189159 [Amylocarpus encephaloides]|uniref:Uncharacterized protein n=1 Tax=Amylocarpus encephaloides TaxID=45428 RepID=A0A9P7YTD2_9HELO|nr:hypothetical protein BJ875DRAFT_189159 [Amylocarpus encephaloides]
MASQPRPGSLCPRLTVRSLSRLTLPKVGTWGTAAQSHSNFDVQTSVAHSSLLSSPLVVVARLSPRRRRSSFPSSSSLVVVVARLSPRRRRSSSSLVFPLVVVARRRRSSSSLVSPLVVVARDSLLWSQALGPTTQDYSTLVGDRISFFDPSHPVLHTSHNFAHLIHTSYIPYLGISSSFRVDDDTGRRQSTLDTQQSALDTPSIGSRHSSFFLGVECPAVLSSVSLPPVLLTRPPSCFVSPLTFFMSRPSAGL